MSPTNDAGPSATTPEPESAAPRKLGAKPTIARNLAEAIPSELRDADRWVAWDHRPRRDGRPSKAPLDPRTGRNAKTNDPKTWGKFEEATDAADRLPHAGGVGVVLTDGPWLALDLDHVLIDGELLPGARDLLATLTPTYIEKSPGGDGLHVWLRGTCSPGWRSKIAEAFGEGTALECYDGNSPRYFTVTGNAWLDAPIAEATADDLDTLTTFMAPPAKPPALASTISLPLHHGSGDDDLDRARWLLLHAGVLDGMLEDRDAWLRVLASLRPLGDAGRVLAMQWSARSAKHAPESDARTFDSLDGSSTASLFGMADDADAGWRARYIEAQPEVSLPPFLDRPTEGAAQGSTAPHKALPTFVAGVDPRLEVGLLSRVPQPRPYLLRHATKDGKPVPPFTPGDGFASMGIAGLMLAEGGVGKTQCILALAVAVVTGRDWLGFRVDPEFAGRRVLLVLAEETMEEVHRRLYAIAEHLRLDDAERRAVEDRVLAFALAGTDYPTALAMLDPKGCPHPTETLSELLERVRDADEPWGLIALDPLARLFPDAESSNSAATFATQQVERLVRAPGTPLVIFAHHSSKAARTAGQTDSRGVTGLSDACRWALTLTRKGRTVELMQAKANYSAPWSAPVVLYREAFGILRRATDNELREAKEATDEEEHNRLVEIAGDAVAALRGKESPTIDGIALLMKRRAKAVRRGIRLAITEKAIVQERRPTGYVYVVPYGTPDGDDGQDGTSDHADAALCAQETNPHTPRDGGTPVPGPSGRDGDPPPGRSGTARDAGTAGGIDDGMPEKPRGRRRTRRTKSTSGGAA